MALIRSLDPERFNAETLARFIWESTGSQWSGLTSGGKRISIDKAQCVLDAMVAEGILSTESTVCPVCNVQVTNRSISAVI